MARAGKKDQMYGSHTGITAGPALARTSIGGLAKCTQRMAVNPCMGQSSKGGRLWELEKPRCHGRRGYFDEDCVVQSVGVESVTLLQDTLDLVRFDLRR